MSVIGVKMCRMETYVDSAGKTVTVEQAENEFRKRMILQGEPLEGDAYDKKLEAWMGTYQKLTNADKRSISAATATFAVGFALVALSAFAALLLGGGILAFILILLIGGVIACVPGILVMIFTSSKKP